MEEQEKARTTDFGDSFISGQGDLGISGELLEAIQKKTSDQTVETNQPIKKDLEREQELFRRFHFAAEELKKILYKEKKLLNQDHFRKLHDYLAREIHQEYRLTSGKENNWKQVIADRYEENDFGRIMKMVDENLAKMGALHYGNKFRMNEETHKPEVDIQNLEHEMLPTHSAQENLAAALLAANIVHSNVWMLSQGIQLSPDFLDFAAAQVHEGWKMRHPQILGEDAKPYAALSLGEKNKDRSHIVLAMEMYILAIREQEGLSPKEK